MKLLYDTLNHASMIDSNRLYHRGIRHFSPLEPRRSNPLDRYQLPEFVALTRRELAIHRRFRF